MAAVHAVIPVIRTHDTGRPCVHTVLKVRQIYLLLCPLVTGNAALETRIFHVIEGIVLHARHDILILHAPHQCGSHLADLICLFAVSLLTPAPARIIRHIDAYSRKKIAAKSPHFFADAVSHLLLQSRVKGSSPCHGNREARSLPVAAYYAPRAVRKQHRRQVVFLQTARRIRRHIIMILFALHRFCKGRQCLCRGGGKINIPTHQPYLLLQRQLVHQFLRFICHGKTIFFGCSHVFAPFDFG